MSWSPFSFVGSTPTDVTAPAPPGLDPPVQTSNTAEVVTAHLPTVDVDGSALTGLKALLVARAPGADPFAGYTPDTVGGVPGVIVQYVSLMDTDAGSAKDLTFALSASDLGAVHTYAAACADHPVT